MNVFTSAKSTPDCPFKTGEKLMEDPNCPKFLEGHVKKLKEAWDDTNEKAQARYLTINFNTFHDFKFKRLSFLLF